MKQNNTIYLQSSDYEMDFLKEDSGGIAQSAKEKSFKPEFYVLLSHRS